MAGNTVTLTFAGDSSSLEKSFSSVGSKAVAMAGDFDKAEAKSKSFGGAMDAAGGAADASESKFMGAADLLDGLGGAFGLPTEGATGLMRSFGDLSGGFSALQPMIGGIGGMFKMLSGTLMTPPMGIILLIGGLVAALVLAYQKSETFRNIVQGAFDTVRGAAESFWGFLSSLPGKIWGIAGTIMDALSWPYKTAFNLVSKAWNNTVGRLSFEIPGWVPGLGGRGFTMPKLPEFHTGGVVPGSPGTEVPILAMAGETVTPAGGGGGATIVQLVLDGRIITEVVHQGLLAKQRRTPLGFNS
jgi:phage-related protein